MERKKTMEKLIKYLKKEILFRNADEERGYLNEYGKGYLAGLKEALHQCEKLNS